MHAPTPLRDAWNLSREILGPAPAHRRWLLPSSILRRASMMCMTLLIGLWALTDVVTFAPCLTAAVVATAVHPMLMRFVGRTHLVVDLAVGVTATVLMQVQPHPAAGTGSWTWLVLALLASGCAALSAILEQQLAEVELAITEV